MLRSRSRFVLIVAVLGVGVSIQGCATRPAIDNVAKFASSLDAVSAGVHDAYALTAQVERRAAVAALGVNYVTSERGPIQLDPEVKFTEAEIDPVKTYLDLLSAYAQQLTYLVSDEPVARVDAATSELAIAASGLSATAFPALNQNVVQQGLQGGRAITEFLIEETLNLELPPIIDRMQPAVESVAELLAAHLGYLRTIAQTRVTEIRKAQSVLLSAFRDDQRVSSAQRLHLLNDAIADQAKFAEMDQLLAAAQDVLPRMVRAHATLRSPASTSATAAVESFENYERRLLALYQTIRRGG